MKLANILLVLILAVTAVDLFVSLLIPSNVINLLGDKETMATRTLGPTNVTTTVDGVTIIVPVSITVTQGEDVDGNVSTPPEDETIAELDARAFAAFAATIKHVKTNGT